MCGRTASALSRDEAAHLLDVDQVDAPELPKRWNVAPTQELYVAAITSDGSRKLRALRWGLVPSWADDPTIGSRLINARAETLTSKPAFRPLINRRRALIAVSGFYERRRAEPGDKGRRQPYYFHGPSGEPLVFAGLWDIWYDAEGRALRTFTIITTEANNAVTAVHHRMPVILIPGAWEEWLSPASLSAHRLEALLAPAPDDRLSFHRVGTAVNSTKNDGPELVLPLQDVELRM